MSTDMPADAVLRAVLESPSGIVIFALDRAYRYLAFNENHRRTMRSIWDVDIEVGRCMLDYITRVDDRERARANFDRALAGEHFTTVEAYGEDRLERRIYEDVYSPIVVDGEVVGLTLYLTDITHQKRAEEELRAYRHRLEHLVQERTAALEDAHTKLLHAQKLESLGVMAGGVAHDFNNLLAVMLGCSELALLDLPPDAPGRTQVEHVREAARQALSLTRQMLAYAGQVVPRVAPVSLAELVRRSMPLLRASAARSVILDVEIEDEGWVRADDGQLSQLLLNLVLNAAESIASHGRVQVTVGVGPAPSGDLTHCWLAGDKVGADLVCLSVRDDGEGMDDETQKRIFDPFFTTKFTGRGLGLATGLGIVRAHEGALQVTSTPGAGTLFEVYLPASLPGEARAETPTPSAQRGLQLEGRVLVVDDEDQVRRVVVEVLQRTGLEVYQAVDGIEACALLEARPDIELVLLDMTMPRLGGEAAFRRLRELSPGIPIVVMSGYTRDNKHLRFIEREHRVRFLQKPFELARLRGTVARLLESDSDH